MHLIILIGLALLLFVQGVTYAIQIKHTPVMHGYTYLSVMTGTLIIDVGATFALYILFENFGILEQVWPALGVPTAVLIIVGGSMAIAQVTYSPHKMWGASVGNLDLPFEP
jgi:hypothetical protein